MKAKIGSLVKDPNGHYGFIKSIDLNSCPAVAEVLFLKVKPRLWRVGMYHLELICE